MPKHVVHFRTRNPLVGALILVVALGLLALVLALGVTVGVALAVLGGATLLGRRLLGRRAPATPPAALDVGREVFPPPSSVDARRLPRDGE